MDKLEQIKGELLSLSLSLSVGFFLFYFIFSFGFSGGRGKKKELGAKGRSKALDCTNRGKKKKKKFFFFPSFVVCTFFFLVRFSLSLFPSSAEKDRKIDERKKKKIQSSVKSSGWPHA